MAELANRITDGLVFGQVLRRQHDGLTVMFIGISVTYFETDEMGVAPGSPIGYVLDRGEVPFGSYAGPYWPLHGTCSLDYDPRFGADWKIVS